MALPGSEGEHRIQKEFGTEHNAQAFYANQYLDHLNTAMAEFIRRQSMVFIATSDSNGECDSSFRAGTPGFVRVVDKNRIIYPEYRGNGVMASLGNISENPHIGMMFIDFFKSTVGLHVNGKAEYLDDKTFQESSDFPEELKIEEKFADGREGGLWVCVHVEEAYIHCSKHIPLLKPMEKNIQWGTDDEFYKGGNYFKVKNSSRS